MSNGPDFTPKCYLDPVLMKEFMGEHASERKTPETEAAKAIGAIPFEQQEQILMSEIVPAAFASQLERQRDEAREECERKQAQIDALMLEYCPDEMTEEQLANWGKHQRPLSKEESAEMDATMKGSK